MGDMVGRIQYTVTHGRLTQILILLGFENFSAMQATLVEKYGAPHEEKAVTMKTPAGIHIPTETVSWRTDSDELILHKYGTDVQTGFVEVRLQTRAPVREKRANEGTKRAASDF